MRVDVDVVVCYVLGLIHEVVLLQKSVTESRCHRSRLRAYPERRVDDANVLNHHIRGIAHRKRDGTFKCSRRATSRAGVLVRCLIVPPNLEGAVSSSHIHVHCQAHLSVAIDRPSAIQVDVVATEKPEGRRVLVGKKV